MSPSTIANVTEMQQNALQREVHRERLIAQARSPLGEGRATGEGTRIRPRRTVMAAVLAIVLVLGAIGGRFGAVAQEATPGPPEGLVVTGDVVAESTVFGIVDAFPAPASIMLVRIQLPPGASITVPADDSGVGAHAIVAGTVTLRGFTSNVAVVRADQTEEAVPAGTDAALEPGDTFVWHPFVGGEIRNDGTELAEYLVVDIRPEAGTPEAGAAATPVP
jgi:hypothetical protein